MQRKKSRFWLFIFSFMPGAGEMYLGFMKMGVSLMLGFWGMLMLIGFFNLGVLAVFPIVLYFYSFFHVHNLASMRDEDFYAMEDKFLFGLDSIEDFNQVKVKLSGKHKKFAAIALIVLGVVMLWQAFFDLMFDIFGWDSYYLRTVYFFVRDDLPRFLLGVVIIWIGFALIRGKKVDTMAQENDITDRPWQFEGQGAARMQEAYEVRDTYEAQDQGTVQDAGVIQNADRIQDGQMSGEAGK